VSIALVLRSSRVQWLCVLVLTVRQGADALFDHDNHDNHDAINHDAINHELAS